MRVCVCVCLFSTAFFVFLSLSIFLFVFHSMYFFTLLVFYFSFYEHFFSISKLVCLYHLIHLGPVIVLIRFAASFNKCLQLYLSLLSLSVRFLCLSNLYFLFQISYQIRKSNFVNNRTKKKQKPFFPMTLSLYMLPVKYPVSPSSRYRSQVFPELGYETRPTNGNARVPENRTENCSKNFFVEFLLFYIWSVKLCLY